MSAEGPRVQGTTDWTLLPTAASAPRPHAGRHGSLCPAVCVLRRTLQVRDSVTAEGLRLK